MTDPAAVKFALTGAYLTSGAAVVAHFAPYIPAALWGWVGATAAAVILVRDPPLSPLRKFLHIFVSGPFAAGAEPIVSPAIAALVWWTQVDPVKSQAASAMLLGIVAPIIINGLGSMSWRDLQTMIGNFRDWAVRAIGGRGDGR